MSMKTRIKELPAVVKALMPEDLAIGTQLDYRTGQKCLLAWRYDLFEGCHDETVSAAMWSELEARGWKKSPFQFNDENPLDEVCNLWAAMLRRLGYERVGDRFVRPA
jgi:hypothetical protein